jgi:hypothetical protein
VRSSSVLRRDMEEWATRAARRVSSVPTHRSRMSLMERSAGEKDGVTRDLGEVPEYGRAEG